MPSVGVPSERILRGARCPILAILAPQLNQTTRDAYRHISVHLWVACAMRTQRGGARQPCAQCMLRGIFPCHVACFRHPGDHAERQGAV